MRDPAYRQQFIDRWFELRRGGVLHLDNLFALIDSLADPLAESAQRNFTKWDNLSTNGPGFGSPNTQTWEEQVDFIKDWLTQRMAWIDSQFPSTVTFAPGPGAVAAGSDVALNTFGGTIYYTIDGSDPRAADGGFSPSALTLGGGGPPTMMTFVSEDATDVSALRPTSSSPGATAWTAIGFEPAGWQTGDNGVGYEDSGSNYASLIDIDVGNVEDQQPHSVYIRYPFNVADPLLLLGADTADAVRRRIRRLPQRRPYRVAQTRRPARPRGTTLRPRTTAMARRSTSSTSMSAPTSASWSPGTTSSRSTRSTTAARRTPPTPAAPARTC